MSSTDPLVKEGLSTLRNGAQAESHTELREQLSIADQVAGQRSLTQGRLLTFINEETDTLPPHCPSPGGNGG